MSRGQTDSDYKSHLITEICSISSRAITCAQRHHHHHHYFHSNQRNIQKPFLDWYLVLRVDENAGLDTIRKNYLRLALLLHPDKNKHPKADTAFKLVSEAYACLSDSAKRRSFNLERQKKKLCVKCSSGNNQDQKCDPPSPSNRKQRVRSPRMLQRMKDLRARFVEEANVIENCLKANAASRISVSSRKELPTFNPSDYLSQGYPHHTAINRKNLENFRHFMSRNHVVQALRVKP